MIPLGIDLDALSDLIDATQWELEVWLCTLLGMLAFGLAMAVLQEAKRRSPVDRLMRRRFGV